MKNFTVGILMGLFVSWVISQFSNSEPIYEWLLAIVDKPFFTTHGMCIILALILVVFAFVLARELSQNYYKACQDLIQLSISKFDKIIQKALKK